ncbi:PIN-like domain-containing protein [Nocardia sp. NPDC003183]
MADAESPLGRRFIDDYSAWLGLRETDHSNNRTYFESATIVVDTNVLLDLYRVSSATRREIIDVLSKIQDRLWIPHQVALEYSRNRGSAVVDRNKQFSDVRSALRNSESGAISKLETALTKLIRFRERNRSDRVWDPEKFGVDPSGLKRRIQGVWNDALAEVDALEAEIELSFEDLTADPVLEQLDQILSGRVGPAPTAHDLQRHVEHAIGFRYPSQIPPGYEDVEEKDTPLRQAGDYLLWRQIIEKLSTSDSIDTQRILLVTGDFKSDWWVLDRAGNPISARPELVDELRQEANADLLMLSLTQLLRGAKDYLDYDVSDEAISEVQEHVEEDALRELLPDIVRGSSAPINLHELSHNAFAQVVFFLLVSMGWEVSRHFIGAEAGVDFIATDTDGARVGIEVSLRRAKSRTIRRDISMFADRVSELKNDIDRCLLITTATCNAETEHYARDRYQMQIIDGHAFCELLRTHGEIDAYIPGS